MRRNRDQMEAKRVQNRGLSALHTNISITDNISIVCELRLWYMLAIKRSHYLCNVARYAFVGIWGQRFAAETLVAYNVILKWVVSLPGLRMTTLLDFFVCGDMVKEDRLMYPTIKAVISWVCMPNFADCMWGYDNHTANTITYPHL